MKKNIKNLFNKLINKKIIPILIILVVVGLNVGYAAFVNELSISGIVAYFEEEPDIRISNVVLSSVSSDAVSHYEDYTLDTTSSYVSLPNPNSEVTYKLTVTNIGNVDMGIVDITGLPENLEYTLTDYKLKDKICDSNNVCNLGISKDFYITIKYKENGYNNSKTNYNVNLNYEFAKVYEITYTGITNNNYPTSILEGETLSVTFTSPIPPKVVPYSGGVKVENYTYENNTITIENIESDIELKYQEKAYLVKLASGTYFKEADHLTNIKTVTFQDTIDIPDDPIETYDLSESKDNSIVGWIDKDYNLFIGSEWKIYSKDFGNAFQNMSGVTNITFNNLNTSEATKMNSVFSGMSKIISLNLSSFNTSNVTSMASMFDGCIALTDLNISSFNTSNVTTMNYMFYKNQSLTSLDVSHFNTSKVTSMTSMFNNCRSLTTLDLSNFDTSNVTSMSGLFGNAQSLASVDLSSFDTSKVTSLGYFFNATYKLSNVDISHFDTSSVTDMQYMFNGSAITNIDLSNFDTSKVTNMTYMFNGASKLTSLDISSFDTSKVTNMAYMFNNMGVLTSLDISNFNTSNVTTMKNMFNGVQNLTSLDLSNFDTSSITTMEKMFAGTKRMSEILVSDKWVIGDNVNITDMFNGSGVSSVTLKNNTNPTE